MKSTINTFLSLFVLLTVLPAKHISAQPYRKSPILLLSAGKDFGSFAGEILRAEGFNEFVSDSLKAGLRFSDLKGFDIVILAQTDPDDHQQKILEKFVSEGGNLIAFRPGKKLSHIFGIKHAAGIVANSYIYIDTSTRFGKGLIPQPLQFHGEADCYTLNGAVRLASFYRDKVSATAYPAVVINHYGKGNALAFLYNLPTNIVYMRQGNYQHAGQEMDGIPGIRAMDMFTNGWVDTSRNQLNQADEQMRLLSHGIEQINQHIKPLPRFWYFPDSLKCLVTLNNDGEDSKEAEFQPQFQDVENKGARMTLYVKETDLVSKNWVGSWIGKGFEISGHPDDTKQAANPDWTTMDSVYKNLLFKLRNNLGIAGMSTVTNHWFVWCGKTATGKKDFAAQAQIEENNGVRLDCNYAHYDNYSTQGHFLGEPGARQGNYTGSGLVMKFANPEGNIINVYQQLNNVYDQQYMENKDPEAYFECFKGLMDRSLDEEVYSFISVRAHNNEYYFSKEPLMRMLDYAKKKEVSVVTEKELLEFLEAKDNATFANIGWLDNRLSFRLRSSTKGSKKISCLVPFYYQQKTIARITMNGERVPFLIRSVKGYDYALFPVSPGAEYQLLVEYAD